MDALAAQEEVYDPREVLTYEPVVKKKMGPSRRPVVLVGPKGSNCSEIKTGLMQKYPNDYAQPVPRGCRAHHILPPIHQRPHSYRLFIF